MVNTIRKVSKCFFFSKKGEGFFKETIVVYIQKGLTLEYTIQALNFFYSHSFSNVGLTHYFFF